MRRTIERAALALILCILGAAAVTAEETRERPRLVIVSVDGFADWLVDEYLARGVLSPRGGVGHLMRHGAYADYMRPIELTITGPSHASLFTGADPQVHGIVHQRFILPGGRVDKTVSPFATPLTTETLVEAAMKQGKRVACVTYPHTDERNEKRTCDITFSWGSQLSDAIAVDMTPDGSGADARASGFSRLLRLSPAEGEDKRLAITAKYGDETLELHAYAAVPAGGDRFTALLLDTDADPGNGWAVELNTDSFATMRFGFEGKEAVARHKLVRLDPVSGAARIYLGRAYTASATPESYARALAQRTGDLWPWAGEPDHRHYHRGDLDYDAWMEQIVIRDRFLTEVVTTALQRDDWDLLLTYTPSADSIQHHFALRDQRQVDYGMDNGDRRALFNRRTEDGYRMADRYIRAIIDNAPPGTNIMLVSDHGIAAVHSAVVINNWLAEQGFALDPGGRIEAWGHADGPAAYIYVNVEGRQKNGIVPPAELPAYVERIAAAARAARNPRTGEPLFETVLAGEEMAALGLAHAERAGDIYLSVPSGWAIDERRAPGIPAIVPTSFNRDAILAAGYSADVAEFVIRTSVNQSAVAVHGMPADDPRIRAVFYAAGPDVPKGPIGPVRALQVAPTAAEILGIAPPAAATHPPISALQRREQATTPGTP